MKKEMLFLAFHLSFVVTLAQAQKYQVPGGVEGISHWFVAKVKDGSTFMYNQLSGTAISSETSLQYSRINQYSSLKFNGNEQLNLNLGRDSFHNATYFTVYQSASPNNEQFIWSLEKNQETSLVLTTSRVADLEEYRYMNFTDLFPAQPKINIYEQQKIKDSLEIDQEAVLKLGLAPTTPQLPIRNFLGLIPEVLIYNRALSLKERQKVGSYLALKYGITLKENNAAYLNSNGEVIWDGISYPNFHNNIAGIGRDDGSGFYQKNASSSNNPNLLNIAINGALKDNHFLIWGDNNLPLTLAPKLPGIPKVLARKWLLVSNQKASNFPIELFFDTKKNHFSIGQNTTYWLAIRPGGEMHFDAKETSFLKMDQLDADGFAHFSLPPEMLEKVDKAVFSFLPGQEILLATDISTPTCSQPNSGKLQVKIFGGEAPYQLIIIDDSGKKLSQRLDQKQKALTINNISAGKYLLKVSDALQNIYIDSFYVNNTDAPNPQALESRIALDADKPLYLDASEGLGWGISYQWRGPKGFQSSDPSVKITKPGNYTLRTEKDGCAYVKTIQVLPGASSIFNSEIIYPNPSNGVFTVKLLLNKAAKVVLKIYDAHGSLILSDKAFVSNSHEFTNRLRVGGIYYVVLEAGTSVSTHQLIISK